jgi:hypothetical protein
VLGEHGRLADGRVDLTLSLFDEWPLATTVDSERRLDRLVAHLRTTVEVGKALGELHDLGIWHVDLNPMNILGAVLYTMLAGYEWTWGADISRSIEDDPEIAPELKTNLLTAVEADPDRRYPSIIEFRDALAAFLETHLARPVVVA